MSTPETETVAKQPRRKRRLLAVCAAFVAVAVLVWLAVEQFIHVERFRPRLETELAELFGLPAQIERLDLHWWPQPHMAGYGVRIGEGHFQLSAEEVTAGASLRSLFRGVLRLDQISSDAVRIELPADDAELSERLAQVTSSLFGPGDDSEDGESSIEIGKIALQDIVIQRGGVEAARVNLELADVLGPVAQVAVAAAAPYLGPGSALEVSAMIDSRGEGDPAVEGTVEAVAFPLAFVTDAPLVSDYLLTGTGALSGQVPGNLQLAAEGRAASAAHPALEAAFNGNLWYRDGQIDINDLRVAGDQVEAVADLSFPQAGGFACKVQRGALDRAALAAVAAAVLPMDAVTFSPESGRMTVLNLLLGQEPDGPLRFAEGEASFLRLGVERGADGVLDGLRARVRVENNQFVVEDLSNEHVQLSGRLTPDFATGAAELSLTGTAALSKDLVRLFVANERIESVSGRVRFEEVEGRFGADETALAVAAQIEDAGITVLQVEGAPLAVSEITGGLRYVDGTLTLQELTGAGFALNGTVAAAEDGWDFELRGQGNLENPLLALALPATLHSPSGAVDLAQLRGRWRPGLALPEGLALEGSISEGQVTVETEAYTGKLSSINGTFSTDLEALLTDLRLHAEGAGDVRVAGAYVIQAGQWSGEVDLNLAALARLFVQEASARRWLDALLASQRNAQLAVTANFPEDPAAPVELVIQPRSGGLEGNFQLIPGDSGWTLGDLTARGPVSAAAVAPLVLEGLHGEGSVYARLDLDAAAGRYTASANLKQAALSYGDFFRKPSGVEGEVTLNGGSQDWSIGACRIDMLGQRLELQPKGAGFSSQPFTFDLAALSPLVPGGEAQGTVSGAFTTSPADVDLTLAGASLPLGGAGALRMDGGLRYRGGLWSFDDLRLQGPRTDCLLTAESEAGAWQGSLAGSSLDLAEAQVLAGLAGAGGGESSGSAQGALAVDLDTVYFGNAAIERVEGRLQAGGGGVQFTDARADLGTGTAAGTVALESGELHLKIRLDQADLGVLEALVLPAPRGLRGAVGGTLDLRFPIGDGRTALKGLSGTADLLAENGSYGETTLATRLISIARTVEVIYLRMPKLNEEGLTFDTSHLRCTAENGRVQISEFTIGTRSYGFEAAGLIDFPADTTDITGKIYAFETVTGIFGSVPVLGSTVDKFKKLIALPVRISGSAFEPEVGRASEEADVEMLAQ